MNRMKKGKGKSYPIKSLSIGDTVVLQDGTEAIVADVSGFSQEILQRCDGAIVTCAVKNGSLKGATIRGAFLEGDELIVTSKKAPSKWKRFKDFLRGKDSSVPKPPPLPGLPGPKDN